MHRLLCPLALLLCLHISACAVFRPRHERAVDQLAHTVRAYMRAHPERLFPRTEEELLAFAAARGTPIDRSVFTLLSLSSGPTHLQIRYTVKTPEPTEGHLAYGKTL